MKLLFDFIKINKMLAYGTLLTFDQLKSIIIQHDPKFFIKGWQGKQQPSNKNPLILQDCPANFCGVCNLACDTDAEIEKTDIEIFDNGCCDSSIARDFPYVIGWRNTDVPDRRKTVRVGKVSKSTKQQIKKFCTKYGLPSPHNYLINCVCFSCIDSLQ